MVGSKLKWSFWTIEFVTDWHCWTSGDRGTPR